MKKAIFYPRTKKLEFYGQNDEIPVAGLQGSIAVGEFLRMILKWKFPSINLKKI